MAFIIKDRVKETSTTTGTSDFVLGGAPTGFQSFSVIGNGNTTYYAIYLQNGAEWEVGLGTYVSGTTTLERTTVLASSNSNTKVSFSAGTKDVFVTYPAENAVYSNNSPTTSGYVLTANGTGVVPSWQALGGVTSLTAGTGISLSGSTGAITVTNTAPDQTVSLTAGSNVTITGTYPSFTIAASGGSGSSATPTTAGVVFGTTTTSSPYNAGVGKQILNNLTTATNNSVVGYQAGYSTTSGGYNVYVGDSAGYSTTTGLVNTYVGSLAGYSATGSGNTALGRKAFNASTSGNYNVAIGLESLLSTTADNNTAVGSEAMRGTTSGTNNAAFGYYAGKGISTGSTNTCIGYQAGYTGTNNITTGTNNILVGANAQASSSTVSNEATWGNSSITSNRFWGDIKLGGTDAGTSGYVLTSQGAGTTPIWAAAGGGGGSSLPITKMQAQSFGGF